MYAATFSEPITVAALAERTTAQTFEPQKHRNTKHRGIRLWLNVTAITATPGLTMSIFGKWRLEDAMASLLADAAVTTATTSELWLWPGAATTANVSANLYLPPYWDVRIAVADADPATYEIIAWLLP
jgi:hypothetical protein